MGFKNLINSFRKNKDSEAGQYKDIHNRLMAAYPEGKLRHQTPRADEG